MYYNLSWLRHGKWRVFSAFVLMLSIWNVQAQDTVENDNRVYITHLTDNVSEAYITDFLSAFEADLGQHNLELVILDMTDYLKASEQADINITFFAEYDSERIIVGQYVRVEMPQSESAINLLPKLTPLPTLGFQTTPEIAADFTTAAFLYSKGRCEDGDAHFQASNDDVETTQLNNDVLFFYRGNCAVTQNDLDDALTYFQEALPSDADFSRYLETSLSLAWINIQLGEEQTAFDILEPLVSIADERSWGDDTKIYILSKRAQIYGLAERYDDAINDLNAAIDISPDDPELYTLRGQMYLALYEWDSALADFNHAIELNPAYADAYYQRGILYYSILQTGVELRPDALADFQHYLALAPEGEHAEDAARYVEQITAALAALGG
jgi:tetratricopeptide (TPR) repeat protein